MTTDAAITLAPSGRSAEAPTAGLPGRIAIFLANIAGGGAQRAMLLFAQEALNRGVSVDIVVARPGGELGRLLPEAATIVDLDAGGVLPALPSLVRYLRRAHPDALYSTMAYTNVVALMASRLAGSRARVVVREAVVPLSADDASSVNSRGVRWLMKRTYPWAHAVIAVSREVGEELGRIADGIRPKITVLPTPVVSDAVLEDGHRPLEHPWFTPGAPPVVLGVGRLHPQKDFSTLLRAFAVARRSRPLRLLVLGEGPERAMLEALSRELGIAPDVELPGFISNPFPYLRRAAAFVLSSRYEGMPTALVQAMAFGTPVVSTDCPGGSRELLQDGRLGALVPVSDVTRLAAAIGAAVDSPRRPDVAHHVRAHFGAREAAGRYLELASRR